MNPTPEVIGSIVMANLMALYLYIFMCRGERNRLKVMGNSVLLALWVATNVILLI